MSAEVRSSRVAFVALGVALALAGCSASSAIPDEPVAAATSAAPSTAAAAPVSCTNATQSYAPGAAPNGGAKVAAIRKRGRLIVGVSADSRQMGARNPLTGVEEGFDIAVAQEVAKSIFGDPRKIEYRVITTAQRIPVLQDGSVDLVARAFTMTCARWNDIAFSSVYYQAGQKLLVRRDVADRTTLADLKGKKVCAPNGSTTIATLKQKFPDVVAVGADTHTDCLVLFQNGSVDAITGDDTILAGLVAQDPFAKVTDGAAITSEPYGLGVAKGDVAFAQYLNALLERLRADGTWLGIYRTWLAGPLGEPNATPPAPVYGRT